MHTRFDNRLRMLNQLYMILFSNSNQKKNEFSVYANYDINSQLQFNNRKIIIARAKNGTGSFLIPILNQLKFFESTRMFIKYVGLILVPIRQVVLQIHDSIYEIKSRSNTTSEDLTKLYETMHLIIGTTDRVKKILKRRHGLLNQCRFFTLDEADKLLSKDFQIRINASKDKKSSNLIIFYYISNHKKTFQQKQLPIAEVSNMMNELMLIGLTHYILVDQKDKIKALNTIYSKLQIYQCIIFCGSYTCVEVLSQNL